MLAALTMVSSPMASDMPSAVSRSATSDLAAHDEGLAEAGTLIGERGAEDAVVIALGEDHAGLTGAGAGVDAPQDGFGRVHAGL